MAYKFNEDMYATESEMDDDDDITVVTATSNLSLDNRTRKHDLFEKPARLIYTDENGLLEIDGHVLSELSRIDQNICVVGICGLYRSGKSYLMNLIAGEKSGFALGSTVQSETKGIWVKCKKHPRHEDQVLVLIDTEGLNDPEKGDPEHDNNLFCLTLLLCSTLIINVKGVFDYDTLDKLAFIGKLAESIKILDGEEADKKNTNMVSVATPRLVMCIRDFFLESVKDGRHYTPDEYLEENLKPVVQPKPTQIKFNITKKAITTYFPKRKCFTLAQPATGNALQKIELLDDDAIDQKFLQDLETLKKYIYERKPKYICNASKKPLVGADLVALITSYVKALRGNTPIQCEDAYNQAAEQRNERVLKKVMKVFKKEMKEGESMTKKQKLQDMFLGIFERTLAKYREESFLYHQNEFEENARDQMVSHLNLMKEILKKKCQKIGAEKLSRMYDTMLQKKRYIYSSANGNDQYEKDMDDLKENLYDEMKDYDKDDLCLAFNEFTNSKKDDKMKFYREASGEKEYKQYCRIHEHLTKEMNENLQRALESEKQKKNEHMEKELDALRAKNIELYEQLHDRRNMKKCSIM